MILVGIAMFEDTALREKKCIEKSYQPMGLALLGQCHEIFDFRFFHESLSPKPVRISLGPLWLTTVANLPPVLTTPAVPAGKFTAGVIDTNNAP